MALIDEFISSGNFLFKYRSFIPLVLFIITPVTFLFDKSHFADSNDLHFFLLCLCISLFGLFIRIIAIGFSNKGTSGRNVNKQIADALNTDGIYSIVRHPLYLGNYFMWIGIILLTSNIWLIIVITLLFWIYYERIIFAEEYFLKNKFSEHYENWASKTPAIIPIFKNYLSPTNKFNFKEIIKREFYGLTALAISMLFVNFIQNYFIFGKIYIKSFYLYFSITSIFLFLILRFLKKKTQILN